MCEMSQLVLGGMAKGHELLQQLLHRGIGSRTRSFPLYYILLIWAISTYSVLTMTMLSLAQSNLDYPSLRLSDLLIACGAAIVLYARANES